MVLVGSHRLDVEIHAGRIAERLEEMEEHLGGHVAYLLATESGFPHQPRTSPEVEGDPAQRVVHGQGEAVTGNAPLVAQSPGKGLAQHQGRILDGVVLVDLQVACDIDPKVDPGMTPQLVEHVVEETEARVNLGAPRTVEIERHLYIGLCRAAAERYTPGPATENLSHLPPVVGHRLAHRGKSGRLDLGHASRGRGEIDGPAPQIGRQLHIGKAVADDVRVIQVVVARHIAGEHGRTRLARGSLLLGQRGVDADLVETNPLVGQRLYDLMLGRPKGLGRERGGSHAVLIGHHHPLEIKAGGHVGQTLEDSRTKLQLLQRVELIIDGRLHDQCPVAVDKQYSFHFSRF